MPAQDYVAATDGVAERAAAPNSTPTLPAHRYRPSTRGFVAETRASHDVPRHRCQELGNTSNASESSCAAIVHSAIDAIGLQVRFAISLAARPKPDERCGNTASKLDLEWVPFATDKETMGECST